MTTEEELTAIGTRIGVAASSAMTFYTSLRGCGLSRRMASRWTEAWINASSVSVQATVENDENPVFMHGRN